MPPNRSQVTSPIPSPWLTVSEAVAYSRRSKTSIMNALRDGSLIGSQPVKAGKWLIHHKALDAWISGEIADVRVPAVTRRKSA